MKLIGEKVIHSRFGEGVVTVLDGGKVRVSFGGDERVFLFPVAFSGALTAVDGVLQAELARMGEASEDERQRLRTHQIEQSLQNVNGLRPGRPGGRARSAEAERTNLAFKCCYCDGGVRDNGLGFAGVCSKENMLYNMNVRKYLFCADSSGCRNYLDGQFDYRTLCREYAQGSAPCSDSKVLRDWEMYAEMPGDSGEQEAKRSARYGGSLAILTTRQPGDEERDRYIFAVYLIGGYQATPDFSKGGVFYASPEYRLMLTPAEARATKFWNYYRNSVPGEDEKWGTGLFRCLSDGDAARLLRDIALRRRGTKNLEPARRLFGEYCRTHPGVRDFLMSQDAAGCEESSCL